MEKWKLPSHSDDPLFQRTYLKPLVVHARCPGCNKLYKIDSRDLKSAQPRFDCVACSMAFTLETDPRNPRQLRAKAMGAKLQYSSIAKHDLSEKAEGLRKCPKCECFNPRMAKECRKCGVIFAKLEDLPLDSKMGALPSLVRAWQDLMSDYENVTKHMAFVDRCEDLQAVPYALKKYEALREAQPQDQIAQEMLHRVVMRAFTKKAEILTESRPVQKFISQVNWGRVGRLAPLVTALGFVLVGFSHAGLRNLIGIGTSLLFITLGMALFLKGRIHWQDFWGE